MVARGELLMLQMGAGEFFEIMLLLADGALAIAVTMHVLSN
jgi:hypothetical protein